MVRGPFSDYDAHEKHLSNTDNQMWNGNQTLEPNRPHCVYGKKNMGRVSKLPGQIKSHSLSYPSWVPPPRRVVSRRTTRRYG